MTVVVNGGTAVIDGAYTVRTFTEDGTLSVAGGTLANVQYVLVAGGGNASFPNSTYVSGGGGGGVLAGNITLTAGSYPVTIGATGNNSSFFGMTTFGGGQGGFYGNGSSGGSGGGGGVLGTTHGGWQNFVGGLGTPGQGHAGGAPYGGGYPPFGPGGGGGAGGPGGTGTADGVGGTGGAGLASDVTGTVEYYGTGGSGIGPNGIGNNSPGYKNYGAGGGIEFDTGRWELGAFGLNLNRVRLVGRYFLGDKNVTGYSIGIGMTF